MAESRILYAIATANKTGTITPGLRQGLRQALARGLVDVYYLEHGQVRLAGSVHETMITDFFEYASILGSGWGYCIWHFPCCWWSFLEVWTSDQVGTFWLGGRSFLYWNHVWSFLTMIGSFLTIICWSFLVMRFLNVRSIRTYEYKNQLYIKRENKLLTLSSLLSN